VCGDIKYTNEGRHSFNMQGFFFTCEHQISFMVPKSKKNRYDKILTIKPYERPKSTNKLSEDKSSKIRRRQNDKEKQENVYDQNYTRKAIIDFLIRI
jgi:hypothetical protein